MIYQDKLFSILVLIGIYERNSIKDTVIDVTLIVLFIKILHRSIVLYRYLLLSLGILLYYNITMYLF